MSGFQLILSSDTIDQGRIKINDAFSATTGLWSGSTGTQSLIHNNETGNEASAQYALAGGQGTISSGDTSFGFGYQVVAGGDYSHAEGYLNTAFGDYSHAEGDSTTAYGISSHSEGDITTAFGNYSHAEGRFTTANGNYSHVEGSSITDLNTFSTYKNISYGDLSHSEGGGTTSYGAGSHSEGFLTTAFGDGSHAEGGSRVPSGPQFYYSPGGKSVGNGSHAEGVSTLAFGNYSHAEGNTTTSFGSNSHSEGDTTTAYGSSSHSEGRSTTAIGSYSHSEGDSTTAIGPNSHAEGLDTKSIGDYSHAEGKYTYANGDGSHSGGRGSSNSHSINSNGDSSFAHLRVNLNDKTYGANADYSVALGGINNFVDSTSESSSILGGEANRILNSNKCVILGGDNSLINNADNSIIFGGGGHNITGAQVYAFGQNCTTDTSINLGDKQVVFNGGAGGLGNNTIEFDLINGDGYWDGTSNLGPADYAEYFEWKDENIYNDERVGYFVSLSEGKIEIGNKNVIGIISSIPAIVGDSAFLRWSNKFLLDEWGKKITQTYDKYKIIINNENLDDKNNFIYIDDKNNIYSELPNSKNILGTFFTGKTDNKEFIEQIKEPILNPKFNPTKKYIPRKNRIEWSPVGLLGKLRVRTSEKITSPKISVDENGMAINGTDYHVLDKIKEYDGDYGIVKVLFK